MPSRFERISSWFQQKPTVGWRNRLVQVLQVVVSEGRDVGDQVLLEASHIEESIFPGDDPRFDQQPDVFRDMIEVFVIKVFAEELDFIAHAHRELGGDVCREGLQDGIGILLKGN